ncbi:MAG: glycosyltransferase family 4 protein [Planctomycetota bacterium]
MRVLQLIPSLDQGGAELYVQRLARALREHGVDASVCALHRGGPVEALLAADEVPVRVLGIARASIARPLRALADARALIRGATEFARAQRVELVQTHLADADWIGLRVARALRVPAVLTFHNPTLLPQARRSHELRAKLRRALLGRSCQRADALIAVGEDVRTALSALPDVDTNKIHVVHSGIVARPRVSSCERAELRARHRLTREHGPVIVTIGRLVTSKGHERVLAAFALVRRTLHGASLWIVGDGPERERLAVESERLGVADHVRFLGARDDTHELLAAADLFVTGTHYEGLGLAAAEALQAELPVVAFAVAGVRDVVGDAGRLIADDDVPAFARAVVEIANDAALARAMSERGRARSARFLIARSAEATLAVYRAVLRRE